MRRALLGSHVHAITRTPKLILGAAALLMSGTAVVQAGRQPSDQVPERVPLDTIRDALTRGDTARAVQLLTPRVAVTTQLDSRTLTDLLLLLWIGRTPRHENALEPWREADRALRKAVDPSERSDAARVFRATAALARGQGANLSAELGAGAEFWRDRVASIAERSAETDPLLAGAIRWVLAFDDLRQVEWSMRARLPMLRALPAQCGGHPESCWQRTPPPAAGGLGRLLGEDSTTLATFRADLDAARAAVWPYNAAGARVRVALAVLLGDRTALDAFAADTSGLPARDAGVVRVIAFAFGGRRGRAAEEMAAHPGWYEGLDGELGALQPGGLAPALFWRLARPLFLQPYNERLVVHRARELLADVMQHGLGGEDGMLGDILDRTPLVQRGLPRGLALAPAGGPRGHVIVSYVPPNMHETVVRLGGGPLRTSLDLALAARTDDRPITYSGYVAEDYDRLAPFDHQVVQYVRDGHRMVDVHAARPVAPLCEDPHPRVGFFLLNGALQMLREVTDTAPRRPRYRFRMVLAPAAYIYSLEFLDTHCRMAARARYVLTVPSADSTRLSDLVLAERVALEEPTRVRGDPPVAAEPGLRVSAGEAIHFYWEAYGLDATEQQRDRLDVHFEIVNVSQDRVGLEQLGRLESAARHTKPLMDLRYRATVPPGTEPLGFGLSVTVPEGARGVYVARLTVRDGQKKWEETARRALYVESGS
jgi:hypothetical protein